ncbi:translation initiation factor IF-2-like [Penaeus chinensis]|uniref:translation initiation factor IF-2-like n=1 Tax=Penaeus chinensis TaxID=139456 RepID=UPI001FB844C3|nr:translation initiation factor IF-2-like [Penaeus chinensis]
MSQARQGRLRFTDDGYCWTFQDMHQMPQTGAQINAEDPHPSKKPKRPDPLPDGRPDQQPTGARTPVPDGARPAAEGAPDPLPDGARTHCRGRPDPAADGARPTTRRPRPCRGRPDPREGARTRCRRAPGLRSPRAARPAADGARTR